MRKMLVLLLAAAVGAAVSAVICLSVLGGRTIETEVIKPVSPEFKIVKGDEMMKFSQAQLYDLWESLTPSGRWRYEMGGVAMYVLDCNEATPLAKTYAAEIIGEVGFAQAIPLLIKYIDLDSPIAVSESYFPPCVEALSEFGVASIPALVDAFAVETQKERRERIRLAIMFCRAHSEAKTYTLGMLAQTADPAKRKALEELLKLIPEEEKGDAK